MTSQSESSVTDEVIIRAAIHPGIGIARVGDSKTGYFIGPEVTEPPYEAPGYYRDGVGALKRQAARFRIYGLNAAGQVIRELTAYNADIKWTAHLANKKPQWYQFQAALDIPDTATFSLPRRNASIATDRSVLAIDPGPRSISGPSVSGGPEHTFDTGMFMGTVVPLGEIRTDEAGRLLVLGGFGVSASPSGAPLLGNYNNSDGWYDDVSDGPVTAEVSIGGRSIPVDPAWAIVAPPNYAPNIIGWRTMYDCMTDVFTEAGWLTPPKQVSFTGHVLPLLRRLSNLQWVNKGFAAMFGAGGPMNFDDPSFIANLSHKPVPPDTDDPWSELRHTIVNSFRPGNDTAGEPRMWPWLYGDAYGSSTSTSPNNYLAMPGLQAYFLQHWADGNFIDDWNPAASSPSKIDEVPLAEQPAMLDRAALHYCLADAFHPGCEMTWPVRHSSMYAAPFRFRHRAPDDPEPDLGAQLNPQNLLVPNGPLYAQGPGDISRWMALPWQGDTATCLSGYNAQYDPYLPTFWPARVPNQVLSEEDYFKVIDASLPLDQRIAAFHRREHWQTPNPNSGALMAQMVADFGKMPVVEARPGVKGDPVFPETLFVATFSAEKIADLQAHAARLMAAAKPRAPLNRFQLAGWENEEQMLEARSVRIRFRS